MAEDVLSELDIRTIDQLIFYLKETHGYEYSNNMVKPDYLRDKNVAELGCGHGFMTAVLSTIVTQIDGYDVDRNAVDYACGLLDTLGITNASVFQLERDKLAKKFEQYDTVVSSDVIEHVLAPKEYLSDCFKLLKSGGVLILSTPNGLITKKCVRFIRHNNKAHVTEFFPEEIRSMLIATGFENLQFFSNLNRKRFRNFVYNLIREIYFCKLYDIPLFLRTVKLISRIGHFNSKTTIKKGSEDYIVLPTIAPAITRSNCDAIIVLAFKGQ